MSTKHIIYNMHNMPVPSPIFSGSHIGASASSNEPIPRNVTYNTYEYICMTCHNSLKQKQPKMPAQACANGLLLSPIPPHLSAISHIECRLVSLWILFIVIFCLVR